MLCCEKRHKLITSFQSLGIVDFGLPRLHPCNLMAIKKGFDLAYLTLTGGAGAAEFNEEEEEKVKVTLDHAARRSVLGTSNT